MNNIGAWDPEMKGRERERWKDSNCSSSDVDEGGAWGDRWGRHAFLCP
jgi:hypothetical protein